MAVVWNKLATHISKLIKKIFYINYTVRFKIIGFKIFFGIL